MSFALGLAVGAIAIVSVPAVNAAAVKARDWLYSLIKGDDGPRGPYVPV